MTTELPGVKPYQLEDIEVLTDVRSGFNLVVWNDDVNTFDWVILALTEICDHTQEQAEQCAYLSIPRGNTP